MDQIAAKIRDFLEEMEKLQGETACISVDEEGKYWLNTQAKEFIESNAISLKDFIPWLKAVSSQFDNLSYDGVKVSMLRMPKNTIICLRQKEAGEKKTEARLTAKEREVLGLVSKGLTNKQIAGTMNISPSTVNVHLDHIYRKLGCSNRVEACFTGLQKGLFLPQEH